MKLLVSNVVTLRYPVCKIELNNCYRENKYFYLRLGKARQEVRFGGTCS